MRRNIGIGAGSGPWVFSKPPLIGWLIAAQPRICGDSEGCIRSARTAVPWRHDHARVYGLAATLYAPRTAFFAALGYLFAIAVSASSLLISTDVPLLVCWVAGLWAFLHYTRTPSAKLAIGFGLAIAIGLNAKYAMIYFPLCALAYLAFTARQCAPCSNAATSGWVSLSACSGSCPTSSGTSSTSSSPSATPARTFPAAG
jgi:4-amino-4-deoxy-L-arabinose transferase-like glycosyltransferase